jgi:PAS domain S-box-containing protein
LSEQSYRALFHAIDDGVCIIALIYDANGSPIDYRFLEANAAFEDHTGLRSAVGRTARELVPDLDQSWFRLYGEVATTGEPKRFENHAPAMQRWFDVYATRVGDPSLRHVALVFKNITERKLAEAAILESESRFRNMADHAPVMLWVTDSDASCVYLNKLWYEFTGQNEATGLGAGWLDAVHPHDRDSSRDVFLAASARREAFRLEYRVRHRDGDYRWAIDAASPRFASDGRFLGYIGSVIDISDRKLVEQQRELSLVRAESERSEAERANRIKDEFLATISHELRTPLNAVLGWAHMLRSGTLAQEKQKYAVEVIERNARSQAQLIEDLLDVSRILSGKLKLELQPIALEPVVAQALETVRPAAQAKQIQLLVELDSTSTVLGDASRLQQVVWNIVSNAVKFTPNGGTVRVGITRQGSAVEVSITDSGQGIAADFLPHVFERFRQADASTTRSRGGLGLGLSIVKHLVEAHGGSVRAASGGEHQGSQFCIRLPLVTPPRESALPLAPPPSLAGLAGLRVLVVDDEPDTREMLGVLLENAGCRVVAAGSAAEGLQILESQPVDIILSDIGMPSEDGYSFMRKVRARSALSAAKVPAIALTAYARMQDRTQVRLSGFQSHVSKPVEALELLAVIRSLART